MKTAPDPRKIYDHGVRFLTADLHMRHTCVGNERLQDALMFPAMVLSAFAAELFFKSLLLLEGTDPGNTHNLHTLFKRLHNKTKDAIEARWDQSMVDRNHEFEKNEKLLGIKIPRELRSALVDCGDAFERMRYIYEEVLSFT